MENVYIGTLLFKKLRSANGMQLCRNYKSLHLRYAFQ